MRYRKKVPPTDRGLSETLLNDGWEEMREPKNLFITILLSIPFMITNALIVLFLVPPIRYWIISLGEMMVGNGVTFRIDIRLIAYIVAFLGLLIAHEFFHAILTPKFPKSQKTFWGITLYGGFVSSTEEMSKCRWVLISILPFVALSIIMPMVLIFFNVFNGFTAFLAFFNAMSSSVNITNRRMY